MELKDKGLSGLLKKTGLMFSALCAFAFIGYFVTSRIADEPDVWPNISDPMLFVLALFSALFFISAIFPSLNKVQPILLLFLTPLPMLQHAASMFSLGSFVAAIILLIRIGFFERNQLPKLIIAIIYFYLCEILIGLYLGFKVLDIVLIIFFMTIFLMFLLLVYRDKWIIYVKEPKPTLSLSAKKITKTETAYLRAVLAEKNFKEIALEFGVKESTVRNTLARVYKKMDVLDRASLMAKCENLDIID